MTRMACLKRLFALNLAISTRLLLVTFGMCISVAASWNLVFYALGNCLPSVFLLRGYRFKRCSNSHVEPVGAMGCFRRQSVEACSI
jgi:hypothetical protein